MLALMYPLFNLAPVGGFQVGSIALAYSLAYWVALIVTWAVLARRLGSLQSWRTIGVLARLVLAAGTGLAAMWATLTLLLRFEPSTANLDRGNLILNVVVTSVVGVVVYVVAAWALRVGEVRDVLSYGRRIAQRVTGRTAGRGGGGR